MRHEAPGEVAQVVSVAREFGPSVRPRRKPPAPLAPGKGTTGGQGKEV